MIPRIIWWLLAVGLGSLALWFFFGGFGVLIIWLVLSVIGALAIGSAALLMRQLWDAHPYAPSLTRFLGAVAALHLVLAWLAARAIDNYSGGAVSPGAAVLTAMVFVVTLTGIDFAATLQRRTGQKEESS